MYRHGLRVSEAVSLRGDQVELNAGLLHVNRLKNGVHSTHPLRAPEIRQLRQVRRDYPEGPYLFVSERGGPMTTSNVRKLITRAGESAGLPFPVHPHMLRHACGYKLANEARPCGAPQPRGSASGCGDPGRNPHRNAKRPRGSGRSACSRSTCK